MSLLKQYARKCTLLVPKTKDSDEGGSETEWTDSSEFTAYMALDSSPETTRGEKEGYRASLNVLVPQDTAICYGDYFRDQDGGTFKVTTEPDMKQSPGSASFHLKNFTAVREDTP